MNSMRHALFSILVIYLVTTQNVIQALSHRSTYGKTFLHQKSTFLKDKSNNAKNNQESEKSSQSKGPGLQIRMAKAQITKTNTLIPPDAIMYAVALALDVATILIDIAAKFVDGKIQEIKMKLMGGVEKIFFHQMAVKNLLCSDFMKYNGVFGDIFVSLKLQYIADEVFLNDCKITESCNSSGKFLPLIDNLLGSTNDLKKMIDSTFNVMKSNENMICSKSLDMVGEIQYVQIRSQIQVNPKSNLSKDDAVGMVTSMAWKALTTLITAIMNGGVKSSSTDIFDSINKASEMAKDFFGSISKKLGFDKKMKNVMEKLQEKKIVKNIIKVLPFITENLGVVADVVNLKIDIVGMLKEELTLLDAKPAAKPSSPISPPSPLKDAFTIKDGQFQVNDKCVSLPIGGCKPEEWLKSLKDVYAAIKVLINKDNWKDSGPAGLLEIAAAILFLGMFGVKLYYFINDLVLNKGSPATLNKTMTDAANQFWFKAIDMFRNFILAQKKIVEVDQTYLEKLLKNEDLEQTEKDKKEAREKRKTIIKQFISELAAFILKPIIREGLKKLIAIIGPELIKQYLAQTVAVVKLVYSIYKFAKAIYNLVLKILEYKKWKSEADVEIQLQDNYLKHLDLQSGYIKAKYLMYLLVGFESHAFAANENTQKVMLKQKYIRSLRFKETKRTKTHEDPCKDVNVKEQPKTTQVNGEAQMSDNEFICRINAVVSADIPTQNVELDVSATKKVDLNVSMKTELIQICRFQPGYCLGYITSELLTSLQINKDEFNQEISYILNFYPITQALVIDKERHQFDSRFLHSNNMRWFRNEKFGPGKALIYSRKPADLVVEQVEIKNIKYDGTNLKDFFIHEVKSSFVQIEIINQVNNPNPDEKNPNLGEFTVLIIGYTLIPNSDSQESTIKVKLAFNPSDLKKSSLDWNFKEEKWNDIKGTEILIKKEEKLNLESEFVLDAYLIPKARQFDESWVYFLATGKVASQKEGDAIITMVDNRFVNDWNFNENLHSSPFKVESSPAAKKKDWGVIVDIISQKSYREDSTKIELQDNLCGSHDVETKGKDNIAATFAAIKANPSLQSLKDIYSQRSVSMIKAINSVKQALCKIEAFYSEHYNVFTEYLKAGTMKDKMSPEEIKVLVGGLKYQIIPSKGEGAENGKFDLGSTNLKIRPSYKNEEETKSNYYKELSPVFYCISIDEGIIDKVTSNFIYYVILSANIKEVLKKCDSNEDITKIPDNSITKSTDIIMIRNFDYIQNYYLNPFAYQMGPTILESMMFYLKTMKNDKNFSTISKNVIEVFNGFLETKDTKATDAEKFLEPYLEKEQNGEFPFIKSYSEFESIQENIKGLLFLHQAKKPSKDSNLLGKKFLFNYEAILGETFRKGEFHFIFPVYIDDSVMLVTKKIFEAKENGQDINELFQLQTADKLNDDIYKVPHSSICYIEVKLEHHCSVADEETMEIEAAEDIVNLGYVPYFPLPDNFSLSAIDIIPVTFFYTFFFDYGTYERQTKIKKVFKKLANKALNRDAACYRARMWKSHDYFLKEQISNYCDNKSFSTDPNIENTVILDKGAIDKTPEQTGGFKKKKLLNLSSKVESK